MINFILWFIIGGVLGWVASLVMKTDAPQGVFLNIVVGILGPFSAACYYRGYSVRERLIR